ncbi:radical SAM protein [Treponema pedis]|uniref:Radical SAM protein n=1 Tax=Treponema pedis str. T A4 TaxID=1291379 RepID=S6A2A5_9SPIR|nr:radical SAM protein [Treponema pedis]AGT42511.1 radical SAM protein [Treponema pedis str. T A4]
MGNFFVPSCTLDSLTSDEFIFKEYESCILCPKRCKVNRNAGKTGFCKETNLLRVAWAGLHFGEEPPVTGKTGSGTIFITGCNLRCSFCQNYQISQEGTGRAVTLKEFSDICLLLQSNNAENINIVTGSHAVPAIAAGLSLAKKRGLNIPVVWNSSAYETEEAIELLSDCVDGWLPDLKTLNPEISYQVFKAPDYPETALKAILKMAEISPLKLEYTDDIRYPFGKLVSGVIVRHLALPSRMEDTKTVLKWFSQNLKDKALLSLMTQYTPIKANPKAKSVSLFENRMLKNSEDIILRNFLSALKIDNGFYQELVPSDDWLPDFNRVQTFSSSLSKPLWHWTQGEIL